MIDVCTQFLSSLKFGTLPTKDRVNHKDSPEEEEVLKKAIKITDPQENIILLEISVSVQQCWQLKLINVHFQF